MKNIIITKGKAIYEVVAELTWRGFGIFLFILGGSAGVGAALTVMDQWCFSGVGNIDVGFVGGCRVCYRNNG